MVELHTTASPWVRQWDKGMTSSKIVLGAASGAAGGAGLDVDEVFSTYLYTGTSSEQSINNGLDLSGEGGSVWIKRRDFTGANHHWFNTASGRALNIMPNQASLQTSTSSQDFKSFNNNGFTLNATAYNTNINVNNGDYVSWSFRKAPKFHDVVTYTGDGNSSRAISHNLDHEVGFIAVKRTDTSEDWVCYHRGILGSTDTNAWQYTLTLNGDNAKYHAEGAQGASWGQKPTTTHFYVDDFLARMNENGASYVAYLFAHNDGDGTFGPSGDQDIIKCGSYTGNTSTRPSINLGFEPQFLMIKRTDSADNWYMLDTMRGILTGAGNDTYLYANTSGAEATVSEVLKVTATGFELEDDFGGWNANSGNYIYMAIRRGPLAEPTSATDVFAIDNAGGGPPTFTSGFPVDMSIYRDVGGSDWNLFDRLRGDAKELNTNSTNAESSNAGTYYNQDLMTGIGTNTGTATDAYQWMWKRAPGYFDVVAYKSTTSAQTINHNLSAIPEMMWIKNRDDTKDWQVYHSALGNTKYLQLNEHDAEATASNRWNDTSPTATQFTVGTAQKVNDVTTTRNYIAMLFGTVAGVSKCGSYTGNDTGQNIDCGFSSGARFVLIKCSSHNDRSWMVFDSVRGIVAGADPFLTLEAASAENYASNGAGSIQNYTSSNLDLIDPYSSGFAVVGGTGMVNENGKSYIFYAIA